MIKRQMDQMAFCLLIVSTLNFNSNTNEHFTIFNDKKNVLLNDLCFYEKNSVSEVVKCHSINLFLCSTTLGIQVFMYTLHVNNKEL